MSEISKNEYDYGFVAFLDILGFKSLVESHEDASKILEILDGKAVNISKNGERKISYSPFICSWTVLNAI